jgi:hypothetical protein
MDIIGYTTRHRSPLRIVHMTKSWEHLEYLHKYRSYSDLLALPPSFKWTEMKYHTVNMSRICSCMGFPNPIHSLEIVYYTPIKRLLIEDRLIDFQMHTIEHVELR